MEIVPQKLDFPWISIAEESGNQEGRKQWFWETSIKKECHLKRFRKSAKENWNGNQTSIWTLKWRNSFEAEIEGIRKGW